MSSDYVVVNGAGQKIPNAVFAELMAAVLARGAPFRFQASGWSMLPFICDGDVITLSPPPARLRLGDVAAFVNPYTDRLTVHRVIARQGAGYLIRGDNTPSQDGLISHAAILGCVTRVERRGRAMRLGLGPERLPIAVLSRCDWLIPGVARLYPLYRFLFKRCK